MRTGLRLLWRDWKGGELTLLLASLLVAIATVTSISLFADRIRNSIQQQAGNLLAADAQVRGSTEVPLEWRQQAREQNLEMADTLIFQAMAFSDGGMQLSSIKAVSRTYPLKGVLNVSDEPYMPGADVADGPAPGEVWLASRLFGALDLQIGDRVSIGNSDFKVAKALIKEPDSAQSFFGVGPRIMMNYQDVEATGAVQVGSRLTYTWLLASEGQKITDFENWLSPQLGEHHRWIGVGNGNQGVGSALDRAESFLLLAGSLGVVLAGVALALAARRYSQRQASHVALLKTLGLTPNEISRIYLINLFVLAAVSLVVGLFLGWAVHWGILKIFAGLLPNGLAPAGMGAYLTGAVSGFVSLMAFAAPPLLMLRQVPPAKVLRSDENGGVLHQGWSMAIGLLAIVGLVYWYSESVVLTFALTGGGLVSVVGVALLAWGLIFITRRFGSRLGKTWRLGLASLQRHSKHNSFQVMIFSVSLLLLFVLTLVRTSLIGEWQRQIPPDTANHFAFNIFSEERAQINEWMQANDVASSPFYPMVRGRMTSVNGVPTAEALKAAQEEGYEGDSDDYQRELNLTWSNELGSDNEVIEGQWWQPGDEQKSLVSLEEGYAQALNLQLGDELEFSIAGQKLTAEVASIRTVQWDSMQPNFFVIFSDTILDGTAASWLTSFYLSPDEKPLINDLVRNYPTVSIVEIDQMLKQVQDIVGQVTLAVEFILLLVLVAGILVLIASIQATLDMRFRESAILRTLGARNQLVSGSLMIEFGTLGLLAGFLAVLGAEGCMYMLQAQVFDMDFQFHWMLWLVGPWIGLLLIGAIGVLSTRRVIQTPPLAVLREV